MDEIAGPELQSLTLLEPPDFPHRATVSGVVIQSPTPMIVNGNDINSEGFTLSLPPVPADEVEQQFLQFLGALSVSRDRVLEARTDRARELAEMAVVMRELLLGIGEVDAAYWCQSSTGEVLMYSSPKLVTGKIVSPDRKTGRDFILTLKGLDREAALTIASQLVMQDGPAAKN